jgi:hypothetical protein
VWLRITRTAASNSFEGWYKVSATSEWIKIPVTWTETVAFLQFAGIAAATVETGFIIKNPNAAARFTAAFDYLRIAPRACATNGFSRLVSGVTTVATMSGLQGATNYQFVVYALTQAGLGASSAVSNTVLVPAPAAPTFPTTILSSAGRPTVQVTTLVNGAGTFRSSLAVDNNLARNGPTNQAPVCATTTAVYGPWWYVDLGRTTDVVSMTIYGRSDAGATTLLNNFEAYVGDTVNWDQNARCPPGNLPTTVTANTFSCVLTGRYVHIRVPGTSVLSICELRVTAANSCPARTVTNGFTVTGTCTAGATLGSTCVQACSANFVPVAGSDTAVCRGNSWSAPPLVCEPVCADAALPANTETCTRSLVTDDFSAGLAKWISLNQVEQPIAFYASTVDGRMQTAARLSCNSDVLLAYLSSTVYDLRSTHDIAVSVATDDMAGILFKAQDQYNYYLFTFNVAQGRHFLDRVVGNVRSRVTDAVKAYDKSKTHRLQVTYSLDLISIYVNDRLIMQAADTTFTTGYAGLYSRTQAFFDDFAVTAPCDNCNGLTPGTSCKVSCKPGFVTVTTGQPSVTRSCFKDVSNVPYTVGALAACTLPPPTFFPTTRRVAENTARNTAVGDPVQATIASDEEQVQYQLVGGNLDTAFWVDSCSGQIRVRNATAMDFEMRQVYALSIRAYVLGYAGCEVTRTVTVNIVNVNGAWPRGRARTAAGADLYTPPPPRPPAAPSPAQRPPPCATRRSAWLRTCPPARWSARWSSPTPRTPRPCSRWRWTRRAACLP